LVLRRPIWLGVTTSTKPRPARVSEGWLLRRYLHDGDPIARERLIESMMPLARRLAAGYRRPRFEQDLLQAALYGLAKAIDRWDESRGVSLRSYAIPTMHGEIRRWLRDQSWSVRLPRPLQERVLAVTRVSETLRAESGRAPTVNEIGAELGLTTDDILEALQAGRAYAISTLDAPLADGRGETLLDIIGGDDERLGRAEEIASLSSLRDLLDERDRRMLKLRFIDDLSQSQIAGHMGCSQMQVSRVLQRALARLRDGAHDPADGVVST
jgi:RNA polymerase sigma-B factor